MRPRAWRASKLCAVAVAAGTGSPAAAVSAAGGGAASGLLVERPPPPMTGKPWMARATKPAPSASWTMSATTSTRTESPRRPGESVVCGHRLEHLGELAPRLLLARGHVLGR